MTASDCSTYSMLTCTVFYLYSIQCFIMHQYGIGIGYWHWDRPILLGIGCLTWYRSNPKQWLCMQRPSKDQTKCTSMINDDNTRCSTSQAETPTELKLEINVKGYNSEFKFKHTIQSLNCRTLFSIL